MIKKRAFLEGHTGEYVRCVAFSPDGKTLASGSDDKTVKLWDVATGKEKATLRGHTDEVWYVAFLPERKTVVSGSLDGTVRLWDVTTGKQMASLRCFVPSEEMRWGGMVASPDGTTLAVVTKDEAVKLLDLKSGKERGRFKGKWNIAVFSFDGRTLALVSGDQVELWDVASGKSKVAVKAGSIESVAFSPDDKTLALGICEEVGEEAVKLYEVGTGRLRATLKSPTHHILSLAFSPDSKTLAVGRYLEGLQLWDATTAKLKADLPPAAAVADNSQFAVSLQFSPDGKILAAGGSTTTGLREKGIVKLWEIAGTK
jgi:WD40 repeat protein